MGKSEDKGWVSYLREQQRGPFGRPTLHFAIHSNISINISFCVSRRSSQEVEEECRAIRWHGMKILPHRRCLYALLPSLSDIADVVAKKDGSDGSDSERVCILLADVRFPSFRVVPMCVSYCCSQVGVVPFSSLTNSWARLEFPSKFKPNFSTDLPLSLRSLGDSPSCLTTYVSLNFTSLHISLAIYS